MFCVCATPTGFEAAPALLEDVEFGLLLGEDEAPLCDGADEAVPEVEIDKFGAASLAKISACVDGRAAAGSGAAPVLKPDTVQATSKTAKHNKKAHFISERILIPHNYKNSPQNVRVK